MRRVSASMSVSESCVRLNCAAGTAYYLRASCHAKMPPFIRVWKNDLASTPVFVPAASEMEFLIRSPQDVRLFLLEEEVSVGSWRRWSFMDNIKRARLSRFHGITRFDDGNISIQPLFHLAHEGLDVARTMRTLTEWGFGTSTASLQDTLHYEDLKHPDSLPDLSSNYFPSIAVVVQLADLCV